VDASPSLLQVAREALPEADLRVAQAAELPFDDGAFDAAVCHSVFHYFPDHNYAARALGELDRVSRRCARRRRSPAAQRAPSRARATSVTRPVFSRRVFRARARSS
jgi:ubiquinone/menaquinone biosynthesis C-methylase UbiE